MGTPPPAPDDSPSRHGSLAHLYRAEMNRMTVWRQRLDITSNWAIILTTALTTFTLGTPEVPHYTLLLGLALIGISILIEGRRYRHLYHSKWRLYLMESGYFAELLHPYEGDRQLPNWRRLLAADLRHTYFQLKYLTAVRVRLRRNYLLLVYFVTAVWLVKLVIHPHRAADLTDFWNHLEIGGLIPAWFVAVSSLVFVGGATLLALSCPPAERLEDWSTHYTHPVEEPESEVPPPPTEED